MKSKPPLFTIPFLLILFVSLVGFKDTDQANGVFEVGGVYKLRNDISSPKTVKVKEVQGNWILSDNSYSKDTDNDTSMIWINTLQYSIVEVIE